MFSIFNFSIIEIPFFLGIIFLVMGTVFYFFPPKRINYFYGYRTNSSMESQEKWDFAQKYSAVKAVQGSVFLFTVSALSLLVSLTPNQQVIIGIAALIVFIVNLFYSTEKALNKQFPKQ